MKMMIKILVVIMAMTGFAQSEDWEKFNSSLIIEVTRPSGVFTCTGVAISPAIVVTAAHCLEGNVAKIKIFTDSQYDPKSIPIEIENYQIHPSYNAQKSRYRSDIAKINLKYKLPSDIRIYPIYESKIIIGNLYRFGFGERNKKNARTVITPKLRRLNMKDEVLELDDTYSRSGDSGGPIYIQNGNETSILAIHSTFSHGPQGQFSYNPILSSYLYWIYSK